MSYSSHHQNPSNVHPNLSGSHQNRSYQINTQYVPTPLPQKQSHQYVSVQHESSNSRPVDFSQININWQPNRPSINELDSSSLNYSNNNTPFNQRTHPQHFSYGQSSSHIYSTPPQGYSKVASSHYPVQPPINPTTISYIKQSSFHQNQKQNQSPAIIAHYQKRKQEYIQRIQSLPDHVQINYPDKGKYIGQILTLNRQDVRGSNIRHGQGIFFYPTGDVYFGGWKEELFHGQGVYMFETGEIYDGLLKNACKDGSGIYYYQNATAHYKGLWVNDLKHGSGLLNSPQQFYQGQWDKGIKHGSGYHRNRINGNIYVGQFISGIKQGKGRMVYADGSVYAGQFKNEVPHGVGDFQYVNKDKYIGQFVEGKKHGRGNYFFSEGTTFSGLWRQDHKVQGQLILFNGDQFNGTFRDNQRYQGVYKYRNGDLYQGTWKADVKSGYGKLSLQNGERYSGNFQKGQKHGEGIYYWKNGDKYEGRFIEDKRQGLGEYFWNQGGRYKGEWKADRMNGYGRLNKQGIDIIGQFHADHFQRPIDQRQLGSLGSFVLG